MIKADFSSNKNNTKGLMFIILFRVSHFFTLNIGLKIIGIPVRILYKIFVEWVLGIEIPDTTFIGGGLKVLHGQGLIVNSHTKIGNFVTLRHNTTIGNSKPGGKSPIIDDYVDVGANCVVIGDVKIGKNSIIGAGSVVVKSVPPNSIVVGNPAHVIKTINN
ncbi:serine O-acetyltransferase [Kriegella aquimaris]|uniref:Putative colanic acid biosynthesis acetyltransferase WcaB n=1 Tax=Kriegella aquimaris TaxID=192904 RepID=A0A1G9U694_9FLAO|nr:hypothetical protein [Kriegella aquimaris]SDM55372.1 putative colanic acid biosynthesis acetyltransferase WcaB [Kriegella aquimaris]